MRSRIGSAKRARKAKTKSHDAPKKAGAALDKRISEVAAQREAKKQAQVEKERARKERIAKTKASIKSGLKSLFQPSEAERKKRKARGDRMMKNLNRISNQRWY